jgi:predicted nucleotide-binding protein
MKLTTANKITRLSEQISAANGGTPADFAGWKATTDVVLRNAVGDDDQLVADFRKIKYTLGMWTESTPQSRFDAAKRSGVLRGVALLEAAIKHLEMEDDDEPAQQSEPEPPMQARTEIFIVHGHDDARKEAVARFVHELTGRKPIILHEQSSGGKTIIEKLEKYAATTAFAVIIATGDDVGRSATDPEDANRPRARQNVVLELGYFYGLLGRNNVVLLFDPGVERPSDTDGILHIQIDEGRGWRIDLANEIEEAGIEVDKSAIR